MTNESRNREIPLLKEYHIKKIVGCLECIREYPYNREKQKGCVLALYAGKTEKSVFRGMVIPTLRKTGLILGYEKFIRASANGSMIVESKGISESLHRRVLRAIVLDIDRRKFGFVQELLELIGFENIISNELFKKTLASRIASPSYKQTIERIDHWLNMLEQVELLEQNSSGEISLNRPVYEQALADLSLTGPKVCKFEKYLIESFLELRKEAGVIVDIADLREKVAIKVLNNEKEILTENQFDDRLRDVPLATNEYTISLGRPMGAEEKLFSYKGKYYRTLSIEFAGGR